MKVTIAHLSDPHFGTVREPVLKALTSCLEKVSPDLVILSGDITQRARFQQFRAARKFTKSISQFPILAIPGNHDIPLLNLFARLFYPYWGFQKIFKGNLETGFKLKNIEVLALNSASRFRHVQGQLNLKEFPKKYSENNDDAGIRVLAFHHPMDCPKEVDEKNLLRGRSEAMKSFAEAKVDLILSGHIHDPYVSLSNDRYPEEKRSSIISVAGTCLSWRTRSNAPNSFHLIDIETDTIPQITITRFDIQKNGEFAPLQTRRFVRISASKGWEPAPA